MAVLDASSVVVHDAARSPARGGGGGNPKADCARFFDGRFNDELVDADAGSTEIWSLLVAVPFDAKALTCPLLDGAENFRPGGLGGGGSFFDCIEEDDVDGGGGLFCEFEDTTVLADWATPDLLASVVLGGCGEEEEDPAAANSAANWRCRCRISSCFFEDALMIAATIATSAKPSLLHLCLASFAGSRDQC